MMQVAAVLATIFSVLIPARMWVSPGQPLNVTVKSEAPVMLVLTDFSGKLIETKANIDAANGPQVDVAALYPMIATPGTYVLWAVPKAEGKTIKDFVGTPLVYSVRADKRQGAPTDAMVTKVEPLRYAVMTTDHGVMTMAFFYDLAPNTVDSFLSLSEQGYYDGLIFHRLVPGFVVQGGDPLGSGIGGPGYNVNAEFSDRKHDEGVLSMARNGDPLESQGARPRPEFANSAGSQFFICLAYAQHLDNRYTAFGKVVEGNDAYRSMAKVPVTDQRSGRPAKPPVMQSVVVKPVTAKENPYAAIMINFAQMPVKQDPAK